MTTKDLVGFHEEIMREVVSMDGLWVLGAGLGLRSLTQTIIEQYEAFKELVIVLNVEPSHFDPLFGERHQQVVAEVTAAQRKARYLKGGVLFITSRILVVDLLRQRLPGHLIAGFLIYNAHRVSESSTESFILRLYRDSNRTGFIKAFSDEPASFTGGSFGSIERYMRALFVRKLFLWPRFKKGVSATLDSKQPDVTQAFIELTPFMQAIHKSIVDVMNACVKELGKSANLDVSALESSGALLVSKAFHRMLRSQLEPVWHITSFKTKQLINDLDVLRKIASNLLKYDAVTFYEEIDSLKKKELNDRSMWLMMDQSNAVFQYARARVFKTTKVSSEPPMKRQKIDDFGKLLYPTNPQAFIASSAEPSYEYNLVLEQNPKWHVLDEILAEITSFPAIQGRHGPILVLFRDEYNLIQIQNYLSMGGQTLLKTNLLEYIRRRQNERLRARTKAESSETSFSATWRGRGRGNSRRRGLGMVGTRGGIRNNRVTGDGGDGGGWRGSSIPLTPVEIFLEKAGHEIEEDLIANSSLADHSAAAPGNMTSAEGEYDAFFGLISPELPRDRPETEFDEMDLDKKLPGSASDAMTPLLTLTTAAKCEWTLAHLKPQYIILYDPELAAVRSVEVYKAYNPGLPCKVYFMTTKDSVEEMLYKAAVEREKTAFTTLIKEKEKMMVTEEQDGRVVIDKVIHEQLAEAQSEVDAATRVDDSSRKGGTVASVAAPKTQVLVDIREFRSKLPNLLHLGGCEVIPITLEMGDYIITPDICIERKSIADLHGSFQSGRLFTQIENLTRYYAAPVLLIEFDENQAFALEEETIPDNINVSHIISRLVLLTQAFPKLRILWSSNPHNTAQLIKKLKEGKKEPSDISDGLRPHHRLLSDDAADSVVAAPDSNVYDPIDVLKRMPGVTTANLPLLVKSVPSLKDLSEMNKAKLQALIGKSNGSELHAFFHDALFPDESRNVRIKED